MTEGSCFDVFRAAEGAPGALALVSDEASFDYAELSALAGRAVAWLSARGVSRGHGEPVAVLARPAAEQIAMAHALLALRVPMLPMHPSLTDSESSALLARAGARLCVDGAWGSQAPANPGRWVHDPAGDDETVMALLETSGSTGTARLCQLSRRAFRASARASAERLGWRQGDSWLLCLPFAHIGGLSVLTRCLARRAAVHCTTPNPGARSTDTLVRALVERRPSLVSLVPTQLSRLLERDDFDLPSSVRVVLVGGAALDEASFERARRVNWPVVTSYGLTEACSQVTTAELGDPVGACGKPLAGVEVRVKDGHIEVRGETLFSGYLGQPNWTAHEWFPTGDLGVLDDAGRLRVLGRAGDRIVSGGENVDPVEVESALATASERRLCVVGRAHPEWGEQVVVLIEGGYDENVVRLLVGRARERLAPFKRPRAYAFVERFPLGPSGKIQRRDLGTRPVALEPLSYSDSA